MRGAGDQVSPLPTSPSNTATQVTIPKNRQVNYTIVGGGGGGASAIVSTGGTTVVIVAPGGGGGAGGGDQSNFGQGAPGFSDGADPPWSVIGGVAGHDGLLGYGNYPDGPGGGGGTAGGGTGGDSFGGGLATSGAAGSGTAGGAAGASTSISCGNGGGGGGGTGSAIANGPSGTTGTATYADPSPAVDGEDDLGQRLSLASSIDSVAQNKRPGTPHPTCHPNVHWSQPRPE